VLSQERLSQLPDGRPASWHALPSAGPAKRPERLGPPPVSWKSFAPGCSPKGAPMWGWNRPGRPPSFFFPPDHQGKTRPRYPGGWGSGVGSHRRCAITCAVTRKRGGRGQAFQWDARSCLPPSLPSRVPFRVPGLTTTLESRREGSLEGTLEGGATTWCQDIAYTLGCGSAARAQCRLASSEVPRSPAAEVVAHGGDDAHALRPGREATELLGVGFHGLTR